MSSFKVKDLIEKVGDGDKRAINVQLTGSNVEDTYEDVGKIEPGQKMGFSGDIEKDEIVFSMVLTTASTFKEQEKDFDVFISQTFFGKSFASNRAPIIDQKIKMESKGKYDRGWISDGGYPLSGIYYRIDVKNLKDDTDMEVKYVWTKQK